ncbi:L-lactate permease [Streptomyces sp. NPDC048491]|uniref:L-lactate permease n=1 Tax=Streptomyces sp. NPDC048491 TaxID=3157207 RepID=UPI00341FE7D7
MSVCPSADGSSVLAATSFPAAESESSVYRQITDPLGHPALTALLAATPLIVLLVLLGVLRVKAYRAALAGLATAAVLAVVVYGMPAGQVALGATEGAAFGLFPIVWIVLGAVWINRLQRASGHDAVISRSFARLSDDPRVQVILIAFCFGAMVESLSGFGTPIAVTSVILVGLGQPPLKAAAIATFANTAPAAFGSVGNPIQALAKVTSFPATELGAMVGRQSAVIAFLVPFVLLFILDGSRGLRELWPVALAAGAGFGAGQYLCSNHLAYQLTDLVAALVSAGAVLVVLRVRRSARPADAGPGARGRVPVATRLPAEPEPALAPAGAAPLMTPPAPSGPGVPAPPADPRREVLRAYFPYALLTFLFSLVSYDGPVARFVDAQDVSFTWPGLRVVSASGRPLAVATFDFGWLGAAGTLLLCTGVVSACVLRVSARRAVRCYGEALRQIRWAALTVSCVLALSYVMNLSGMAVSLGVWLAGAGRLFALLSGLLGWFGVALTGSDTSSNALFGAMQVTAAQHVGISPLLAAATNSTGGVQGKAAAMQNLVIAAGAVGLTGREGDILRKVIGWSLAVLTALCVLAWLQSTSVLGWMVP